MAAPAGDWQPGALTSALLFVYTLMQAMKVATPKYRRRYGMRSCEEVTRIWRH